MNHPRLALFLIGLVLAAGALTAHFKLRAVSVYSGADTTGGERKNLAAANSVFADQLKRDKNSELDVMAMMKSEEETPEGRKALVETIYNRANAHGVTDIQKALGNRDKATGY